LESSEAIAKTGALRPRPPHSIDFLAIPEVALYGLYALALGVSISVWFLAFRAPLWLDETLSFFIIKGRFSEILSRQGWPGVPAYPYLLWLWTKAFGTGESALRMFSVLAMLGAIYLLYRAARELFDWDVAIIAVVLFCLHPIVVAESIDVRPYAFAVLAITTSIFVLVRLRHNDSNWLAALFGFSAACIVYFQFLFVVIVPALAICLFALKVGEPKTLWRQFSIALAVFALAFLPVLPGLQYLFHTSDIHVFSPAPRLAELGQVLGQKRPAFLLVVTLLIAAVTRRLDLRSHFASWPTLLCVSLALLPILILFGVSAGTSIHVFVDRYRLVAVPGVALCWALVVRRIDSRVLRLLFCLAVVAVTAYHYVSLPSARAHNYTWKYALEFAETNASPDGAPVLICSDLPEADHLPMPTGSAVKDSAIFAPLSYYRLSVPVVPLPRALNGEATRIGSQFLQEAALRHERFLALAFSASYNTLDWLASNAAGTHSVRELGVFDGVKVLEFSPRTQAQASP
jgi:Dolichyl-phosphate-mannose-protein mannosyltransferase